MKAFVITIAGLALSETGADRCIRSGWDFGVKTQRFPATNRYQAEEVMRQHGLDINHRIYQSISDRPVGDRGTIPQGEWWLTTPEIGCAMSHLRLWLTCIEINEPLLILEHDVVWVAPLPPLPSRAIAMDLHPTTFPTTAAYVITPRAAKKGVEEMRNRGVQPSDEVLWRTALRNQRIVALNPPVVRVEDKGISTIQFSKCDRVHTHLAVINPWQDFNADSDL